MITNKSLEKRRNLLLKSKKLRKRYEIIRKAVEGEYSESEQNVQLKWFTPHGPEHCKAVENNLYDLMPVPHFSDDKVKSDKSTSNERLSEIEWFFLIISAWLHDLGMIKGSKDSKKEDEEIRDDHHTRSEKYIAEHYAKLHIFENEAPILGLLAFYHRRRCKIDECPEVVKIIDYKERIRVRLLAAYLRLADAMHVDTSRAPSSKYAILLTYNIPTASKLHWLKSNFLLGISTDLSDKSFTVIFKKPTDEVIKNCINDTTYSIHEKPKSTFKGNETPYQKRYNLFINTLESIYSEIHQDLQAELDSVKEVLIRGNISCFLNVKKVNQQVAMRDVFINDLKTILHHYPSIYNPSGTSLYRIIVDTLLGICDSTRHESDSTKKDKIIPFIKDVEEQILAPRKSYIALKNLIDNIKKINNEKEDKRAVLKKILELDIKDVDKRIEEIKNEKEKSKDNPLTELEIFLYHKHDKLNSDVARIRENAASKFEALLGSELFDRIYQNSFLNKDSSSNKERSDYRDNSEKKIEEENKEIVKERVNILLYGYSELVVKTLCGFRDAVINKIIADMGKGDSKDAHDFFHLHKIDIEKTASNFFRIFVCEGQPKNRIGWGGKVVYHDGTNYALKLQEYGFTNIFLIPDATAAYLLNAKNENTNIHFVLMGANSYKTRENGEPISFKHSTGHAMIAGLTKNLKDDNSSDKKIKPKLIFTVTTDKKDSREEQDKYDKFISFKEEIEDLYFVRFKYDEVIKKRFFFAHNADTKKRLKTVKEDIMIYNPKEEEIDGIYDIVINEIECYPPIQKNSDSILN